MKIKRATEGKKRWVVLTPESMDDAFRLGEFNGENADEMEIELANDGGLMFRVFTPEEAKEP